MSKILTAMSLRRATLELIEAQLRDGGGEERQPPPRKFVFSDERGDPTNGQLIGASAVAPTLDVWTGQEPGERIANTILLCAIRDRAHQVTLEPGAKGVKVRFEIAGGVREQKLPAFALAPIVRHFRALAKDESGDDCAFRLASEVRIAVDEQFYAMRFTPLQTQWGNGVKVWLSPQS